MRAQPPEGATVCSEPGCERFVVRSAVFCRVHLAESMRREGKVVLFEDPELHLRVAVPAAGSFIPHLRSATEALLREVVGPDEAAWLSVTPAEDPQVSWSEVPG